MENIKTIYSKEPLVFSVNLTDIDDRLDCAWFNPITENEVEKLRRRKNNDRKLVKLHIIANVDGGKRLPQGTTFQDDEANIIPYIRATDIKNLKVDVDNAVKITKEIHRGIQNYQLVKNDLAITIVGTIGEVGILDREINVCDFTENIARIRLKNENILGQFLLHYLDSSFGKMQTNKLSVGSLQYKLSLKSCRDIEIYIPMKNNDYDFETQQKIIESMYSFVSKAEECRFNKKHLIEQSKSIFLNKLKISLPENDSESAIFIKDIGNDESVRLDVLFHSPLHNELLSILKKYPHEKFGELMIPQSNNLIAPNDYYRLIDLEQIDEDTGRIIKAKDVSELGSDKILLEKNSIIISKLQPEKGKVAIVTDEFDGCVGSSEFIPFVLNSDKVLLEYIWLVLRSEYVLKQWGYELTGSSRMRIGPNEINNTIIPLPDLNIQADIVKSVKDNINKIDRETENNKRLLEESTVNFNTMLFN